MKIIKRLVIGILTGVLISVVTVSASAADINNENSSQVSAATYSTAIIQPRADVIVTKTRIYNKTVQYRRWNKTKNCWVDPYWITV